MTNSNGQPANEEIPKRPWWLDQPEPYNPPPLDPWSFGDTDSSSPTPDPWDFGNDDGFDFDDSVSGGGEEEEDSDSGDLREPGFRRYLFGHDPGEFGESIR